MNNVKFVDDEDEECHDNMDVKIFPSLEELTLFRLPGIERLLKLERREMFPCLSVLKFSFCDKLRLPCLPYVNDLQVVGCNIELLSSISSFYGLTTLNLSEGRGITSFPEGMFRNLTCLQTLTVNKFSKLKELLNEPFNVISSSHELNWKGMQSLRTLTITDCEELRCFPEGIRFLTSLEDLTIYGCPTLEELCKKETGEDWNRIAHIPNLDISL